LERPLQSEERRERFFLAPQRRQAAMFPIHDNVPTRNVPLATWALILANCVIFVRELALPPDRLEQVVAVLGMVPARLGTSSGSWASLLSCMFLHGDWTHLIGNMWTLYLFGDNVEDRMGSIGFLLFYFACGLCAGLTHYAINPDSLVPVIGASGAIAGVLGAYLLLFPRARVITLVLLIFIPLFVEIPAVVYLGLWFAVQLFSGAFSLVSAEHYQSIAWWAHVGGFAAGMVLLPLFAKSEKRYRHFYADEYAPW
jgi:membrane associated rhomboid family serine protease